jgi:hypothetical protein
MANFERIETSRLTVGSQVNTIRYKHSTLTVIESPFSNCQIFCVSPFYCLVLNSQPEEIMDLLTEISKSFGGGHKRLCQVDLKLEYFNKIKDHIEIYKSMPYLNLTGSNMVQVLIKLTI